MFVDGTFLGAIDRLSIRSILTSGTGSICGILGTIVFIILCFVLFLGPLQLYFQGDYIESSFMREEKVVIDLSTGCDFKMAISFHHLETGEIADHEQVASMLDIEVSWIRAFFGKINSAEKCRANYFEGAIGDPNLQEN